MINAGLIFAAWVALTLFIAAFVGCVYQAHRSRFPKRVGRHRRG